VTSGGVVCLTAGAAYRGGMRAHGRVSGLPEAGATDHVCWVYADDGDLDAAVRHVLDGALARNERLLGVGEGVIVSLDRVSTHHGGSAALATRGMLETLPLVAAYDATGELRPDRQLEFYDTATRRALADGFSGLRAVAEVSALAADADRRPELVRWEHLADDYIAHGPGFTALCAYRADLGREALADISAVHPMVHTPGGMPPFQVFFDDDRIVLTGSVDAFGADRLEAVLNASPADGGTTLLDLGLLEFIDVAGCRVLAARAARLASHGGRLELTGASHLVQRMWQTLSFHGYAPVTFAGARA
jgi:anti-anti-sigma factor